MALCRAARLLLLSFLVVCALVATSQAQTKPQIRRSSGFNLFAFSAAVLDGNRVECFIDNQGNTCAHIFAVSAGGGGFWPSFQNQYIFNSGLQIAGIIPGNSTEIWAGDTVGAYFMDTSGGLAVGSSVTNIFNSQNLDDLADWPNGAIIRDPNLYHSALLGRKSISEQDSWVWYWDGDATLPGGREHPMGVLIEQRTLAWNYPSGNEDIIYLVYTIFNVSASDPLVYAGLDPLIRDDVAAVGARFHANVKDELDVDLPSSGYRIDSIFVSYTSDPDVGNVVVNSSTAILPFDMGIAYKNDFNEPNWLYSPDINGPPFGPYPGFVGSPFLQTPRDVVSGDQMGMALFSNMNGCSRFGCFPPPGTVPQLWRYLSGSVTSLEGEITCSFPNPREGKLCVLFQAPFDTRYFQSTGPFSLDPGESATVVVGLVFAAPLASIASQYFRGNLAPGIPPSGAQTFQDPSLLRDVELASGWAGHTDANGDGVIQAEEVVTVERSLLHKAQLAQSLVNSKFMLPSAPEVPRFFLLPGDNSITVVWEPSATETVGDPYFAEAGDPGSGLYDANYREFDVEGYRIYRGRTTADMEVIAQFDYAVTTLVDRRGAWDYGVLCAPELGPGFDAPPGCPVDFGADGVVVHDISGDIPQVRLPGRAELTDGTVILLANKLDTTWPDREARGTPGLTDTGVPFAFVDNGVENLIEYVYAVTAFDVNSINSGPSTLESSSTTRRVTPVASPGNRTPAVASFGIFGRGVELDRLAVPNLDTQTGIFDGPSPPSDLFTVTMQLFAEQFLTPAEVSLRIDSIVPQYYHDGTYYLTQTVDGVETQLTFGVDLPLGKEQFDIGQGDFDPILVSLPVDSGLAATSGQAGLPFAGQGEFNFDVREVTFTSKDADWHPSVDGAFFNLVGVSNVGGSRWFDGANETMNDPTLGNLHGRLSGVTTIFSPAPFNDASDPFIRRPMQTMYHVFRAADIEIYWGSTPGLPDSVIDVTHNVSVEFSEQNRATYGFITDNVGQNRMSIDLTPDGILTYFDLAQGPCFINMSSWDQTGCETRAYSPVAVLGPTDIDGDGVSDGNGFAMMINGEFFFFQTDNLPSRTVWTYRSYFGDLDYDDTSYSFIRRPANAAVPGLELRITVESAATLTPATVSDLETVHTVPDPYYVTGSLDPGLQNVIRFVNLPDRAIIRIYSTSGILVAVIEHNDPTGSRIATWDVLSRNVHSVASGVYFYHIETPEGRERIGRFTIVNAAGSR